MVFLNPDGRFESLNISVSAAIIIQNLTYRLRNSNIDWHLSENMKFWKSVWQAKNSIKISKRIEERYFEENPQS
jgi:tRNA (guanosine-2'-O-)-methyltransferase